MRRRPEPGPPTHTPSARGGDVPGLLLAGVAELLGLLTAALLNGLLDILRGVLGRLAGRLRGVLGHLLAALERLLAGLRGTLLHVVGHGTDLLVFDPRRGDQHSDQKPRGDASDGKAERILLGDTHGLPGALLDVGRLGRRIADAGCRALHLLLEPVALIGDRLLDAARNVGLVGQLVHGVAHPVSRVLYLFTDSGCLFAHSTSSFKVSIVCSGCGGVASSTLCLPWRASTPAIAP